MVQRGQGRRKRLTHSPPSPPRGKARMGGERQIHRPREIGGRTSYLIESFFFFSGEGSVFLY